MRYAIVTWLDAHCSESEISSHEALSTKPILTESVGHVVAETPEGVTLAVDHFPEIPGRFKNWHFIGSNMLRSITYLEPLPDPMEVEFIDDD